MTAASSWPRPFASMPIGRVKTLAGIHVPTNPMGASLLIHDHDALMARPPVIDSSLRVRLPTVKLIVLRTLMHLEFYCFDLLLSHQRQEWLRKLAPDHCCLQTRPRLLKPSVRYHVCVNRPTKNFLHHGAFCCFLPLILRRVAFHIKHLVNLLSSSFAMR